jgi:hypothetical protein
MSTPASAQACGLAKLLFSGMLDADFTIVDSPELVDALRKLTKRYQRAIDASQQAPG